MKWEGNRESDNVEDRRGGGGGGLGGRSIGIGSIAIALIASWLFGISPMTRALMIECLPAMIPEHLIVDVSELRAEDQA